MGVDEKDSATIFDSSKHDRASANENAWIDAYGLPLDRYRQF